ncbi:MAG TPA: hypothetical protein VLG47_05465 [Candidatus Saccharimonadales bacterium]|nr:hypothetical protein [Candidatus Saccharimonadales bacterium]
MKKLNNEGQTLIALTIYMVVAMIITLGAVAVTIINIRANTSYTSGELALQYANDGVENALIRLERDSSYTGETMSISSGSATITVAVRLRKLSYRSVRSATLIALSPPPQQTHQIYTL